MIDMELKLLIVKKSVPKLSRLQTQHARLQK